MPKPVEILVKPHGYQPSKAELEEPLWVDATPQELAKAIMTPVRVVTFDAKRPAAKPSKRRITRGAGTGSTPKPKPQRPSGPKLPPGPGETKEFQEHLRMTGAK